MTRIHIRYAAEDRAPKYHLRDGLSDKGICGTRPKKRYLRLDEGLVNCKRCLDKIKNAE